MVFMALRGLKTYFYTLEKERVMRSMLKIALVLVIAMAVVVGASGCGSSYTGGSSCSCGK